MIDPQQPRRLLDAAPDLGARMFWHFSGKPMFWRTFMCG